MRSGRMWKADGVALVIAIDGPAGSGKSTLARRLAETLGLAYLNTGAMYRALAARALAAGVEPGDEAGLVRVLSAMEFSIGEPPAASLRIEGVAPGPDLEGEDVEAAVSRVARHPAVRLAMRDLQRDLGRGGAVVEGRDIGTVVFPEAALKVFLVADEKARASRRRRERGGGADVEEALASRDRRDAEVNPPVPATDAFVIDTGVLDTEATFRRAVELARAAWTEAGA